MACRSGEGYAAGLVSQSGPGTTEVLRNKEIILTPPPPKQSTLWETGGEDREWGEPWCPPRIWTAMERRWRVLWFAPPYVPPLSPAVFRNPCDGCERSEVNKGVWGEVFWILGEGSP